jgi:hypothetical protein
MKFIICEFIDNLLYFLISRRTQQVSSTSAVNTVVETLIGNWEFFFDGDVNFYETLKRGEIFSDNGDNHHHQSTSSLISSSSLSKPVESLMSTSMIVGENVTKNGPGPIHTNKLSHSRSSSHDTSLILLSSDPPMKSSQSNSSLSDTSPTTGSPKFPSRNRKPKAPVPPAISSTPQPQKVKLEAKISAPMSVSKLLDTSNFSYIDSDPALHVDESARLAGQMKRTGSIENILSKPDRPPRPIVVNAESQTLSRAIVRQVPLKDKSSLIAGNVPARPVAAPRTTATLMKNDLGRSEENLDVTMREKPAIPDRPVTLLRPASFRAATGSSNSPTSILTNEKLVEELSAAFANKASSTTANVRRNNSLREGRTSESTATNNNNNKIDSPQSKQVTMYNIEKQQVSIVDMPLASGSPQLVRRQLFASNDNNSGMDNKENNLQASSDALNSSSDEQTLQSVPPSPRDGKLKRPQVPPPARPRSSDADSTHL